ncbi:MAG: class I SAM-dependent methyltransferase [Terracidiphilus sp.]
MLSRWFEKKQSGVDATPAPGLFGPRVARHSGAWAALRKRLVTEPGLRIIDVGYTSPQNVNYLTSLGHSVFLSDLVHDACTGNWQAGANEEGDPVWDTERFLEETLRFGGRRFDAVLLWTALDYLPEPLVAPVVQQLFESMNPGGQVLAFFHTRLQGEETEHSRLHVTAGDDVEAQLTEHFPILRTFTNRSIERLFAGWSGHRQFLAKDSVSEVLITR